LPQTQEPERFSEANSADWLLKEIVGLAEAFGEGLTAERQVIYATALADIPKDQLRRAVRAAINQLKWFPKVAELRELAGALLNASNDGRPAPEEAWARMPKGRRMEENSIVWCEEERIAYAACRSLLLDGDRIAARMAFKETYEHEVAEARAQNRPVRWSVSVGFDVEHRLLTLAAGVQEKRITLEHALNFVPEQRRADFSQMLPSATTKGLLVGNSQKMPDLPGLPGLLSKMQMQDLLPDQLKPESQDRDMPISKLSPEELLDRRAELKEQINLVRRSRNGSGGRGYSGD
jgi:hypothetical protein